MSRAGAPLERRDPAAERRRILPGLAIAALSVTLTLVAAELVLRATGTEPPPETLAGERLRAVPGGQVHCPDPRVSRPYFESRPRHPGCAFYPRNNIATRNLFDVRDDGSPRFRVVGLGDSVVFGYGVDHEDTFLYKLQRALEARGGPRKAEVVNAGWPGFDLEDAYRLLHDKVLRIGPDAVVLGLHPNDFLRFPTLVVGETFDFPLRRHLRLADQLLHRLERKRSGERNLRETLASYDAAARERLFEQLRRFESTLSKRGIPLLVLIFPVLSDLEASPFREIHRDVADFLRAEGIDHIDFLPHFAGARDEDYWATRTDQHPNERAHQIFFEQLLAFVEAHPRWR